MSTHIRIFARCCLVSAAWVAPLVATTGAALAQGSEVERLRSEVERMTKLIEVQNRALLNLEQRLRTLESGTAPPQREPVAAPRAEPLGPLVRPGTAPPPLEPGRPMPQPEMEPEAVERDDEPIKREAGPGRALETVAGETQGFFGQRFTLEPSITYSRFDRSEIALSGFLALDAIFLGNISVDEVESDIVTAEVTGRMGFGEDLQVDVSVPYVYRTSNFISGGAGGGSTAQIESDVDSDNLGDIGFGMNYRILDEGPYLPDVVVNVRGRAPTGTDPFGIELETVPGSQGNLTIPEELPTGSGVWQASGGLSFLKTVDPALLFASVDYFHNFKRSFGDIDSAPGDQPGEVDVGDSIQFGLGIAYALNERLSLSLSYTQRLFEKTETKFEGGTWQEIVGSDANVARLNTGLTYALTDNLTFVSNVSAGLTQDAADVEVQIRFPYTF